MFILLLYMYLFVCFMDPLSIYIYTYILTVYICLQPCILLWPFRWFTYIWLNYWFTFSFFSFPFAPCTSSFMKKNTMTLNNLPGVQWQNIKHDIFCGRKCVMAVPWMLRISWSPRWREVTCRLLVFELQKGGGWVTNRGNGFVSLAMQIFSGFSDFNW